VKAIEASFRQDCLNHVKDPTPWLVFSDWLEEDGQSALAAAYRNRRFRNSIGMEMVLIPAGTFWMGGGGGQPGEKQVAIAHDFSIGVYPVTQEQWWALMGNNPSHFSRAGEGWNRVESISDADLKQFPVESVSWVDAQEFLYRLNTREPSRDWEYRLPTAAQWEYSCRGGAASPHDCSFHFYFNQPTMICLPTRPTLTATIHQARAARACTWSGQPKWARTSRTASGSTTCTATSGSGARTSSRAPSASSGRLLALSW